MTPSKRVTHWECDCKLLCGASLDVEEDRFILDIRWVKYVDCPECVEKVRLAVKP